MSDLEIIDELTDIVERQARIIRGLHGIVQQINATTSLDKEIAEVQANAQKYTGRPE